MPVPGLAPGDAQAMAELTIRFPEVRIPDDLAALLRSGFEDFTETRSHWMPEPAGHGELVPWLLPVFVSPPPGMEARPWEPLVQALLVSQLNLPDRVVVIRLARRVWKAAPPIDLPLTILEASGPGADWLAGVRARQWYQDSPEVREFGVRLEREVSTPWFLWRRRAARPHIVLERTPRARRPSLLEARRRAAPPRLFVSFNDGPLDEGLSGALSTLPQGSSLLRKGGRGGCVVQPGY
jgi:hypothetical protein